MRKTALKLLSLLTVCVMLLGMAACSQASTSQEPSTAAATTSAAPANQTSAAQTASVAPSATAAPSASAEPTAPAADISPITLSLYVGDYWASNYVDPSWTDPIAVALTKRTGVTLKVIFPGSSDDEGEMNKQIASGDMADLIFRTWGASEETLATGGYVKPLDDLIAKYGPNIMKNLGGSFPAWKNRSDGKIYNIGFWYFNRVGKYSLNGQVNTLWMRYDILKALNYPKLDRSKEGSMNSFITLQDYYALIDHVKAKQPDLIPALVKPTDALDILYRGMGKQIWNGIWENGVAVDYAFSSDALWAMKEVNGMFQKGYANINNTTAADEAQTALISDGKVFSCLGYASMINNSQATLSKSNPDRRFVMFYLTKDDTVKNVYINHAWGDAASGIHINAKLDDAKTIRAMQFLDYCSSDEGSLLVCSGVEGISYTKDASTGWYKPNDDVFAGVKNWDAAIIKKTGVGGWWDILPNLAGFTADGHMYDINDEQYYSQDVWAAYNTSDWKHFADNWIVSPYGSLDAKTQADAVDADSKISAYKNDRLTNIMLTKDASTIEKDLAKLQAQMKSDGIDTLQKAWTDNWIEVAKAKGRAPENLNQTPDQLGQ